MIGQSLPEVLVKVARILAVVLLALVIVTALVLLVRGIRGEAVTVSGNAQGEQVRSEVVYQPFPTAVVPLLAALACLFVEAQAARRLALLATLVDLALGLVLWANYDIGGAQWQFTEKVALFAGFN